MDRRSFLASLLGGVAAATFGCIASSEATMSTEAVPVAIADSLDKADVEFSQRPQLHYNRQRQFNRPNTERRRNRRANWRYRRRVR